MVCVDVGQGQVRPTDSVQASGHSFFSICVICDSCLIPLSCIPLGRVLGTPLDLQGILSAGGLWGSRSGGMRSCGGWRRMGS